MSREPPIKQTTESGEASVTAAATFIDDLGLQFSSEHDRIVGEMTITRELMAPGADLPRISVLATVGDVLIGDLVNSVSPTLALTIDLAVHLTEPIGTGRLHMGAGLIKAGRTLLVGEARWRDPRGAVVANCWASFMVAPGSVGAGVAQEEGARRSLGRSAEPTMTQGFADALGIRLVGPGVTEVDLWPYVTQSAGTLQGGVVSALGEVAAVSVLGSAVTSLEACYLSGSRVGPARATAEPVGRGGARVPVVDTRRTDRVASVVHAWSSPGRLGS